MADKYAEEMMDKMKLEEDQLDRDAAFVLGNKMVVFKV